MPTPQFPTFGSDQFEASKKPGCASDACDVNFIINKPSTPTYGNTGDCCCDCPPGPQGPPGPPGPTGSSESICGNTFAGPLLPPNEDDIDQKAFDNLISFKGYIVALRTQDGTYDINNMDASVTTDISATQAYINPANGTMSGNPNISGEKDLYPIAYRTISQVDPSITYDNYNPTFEQFIRMCGVRDRSNEDFYLTGTNRRTIPTLLNPQNNSRISRTFTFISNDSSVVGSANGPYNLGQFKETASGVVDGTVTHSQISADNPKIRTDLGLQITTNDGIGVAYECEDCIQAPEENKLTDLATIGSCDSFIDTENGVLYTRDKTGEPPTGTSNWPSGIPRFNANGIPLRREPNIPEQFFRRKEEFILATIVSSTPIFPTAPFHSWKYTFRKTTFVDGLFIALEPLYEEFAYNGAEAMNDIEGIGEGLFDGFTGSAEMLPIRNGTVVHMKKQGEAYIFSMPNAYKVRCE
jgi:hypothetical protein